MCTIYHLPIPFQCIYMFIKDLVKVTFPSLSQYLNGSLCKDVSSLMVYFSGSDNNKCNSGYNYVFYNQFLQKYLLGYSSFTIP